MSNSLKLCDYLLHKLYDLSVKGKVNRREKTEAPAPVTELIVHQAVPPLALHVHMSPRCAQSNKYFIKTN